LKEFKTQRVKSMKGQTEWLLEFKTEPFNSFFINFQTEYLELKAKLNG